VGKRDGEATAVIEVRVGAGKWLEHEPDDNWVRMMLILGFGGC
jgi:hypothetical protein